MKEGMGHLKAKAIAGADFVLCQFEYDVTVFLEFVHECRLADIGLPIIPGIMPMCVVPSMTP